MLLPLLLAALARPALAEAPEPPAPGLQVRNDAHMLGLRYDYGLQGQHAVGLGYVRAWESRVDGGLHSAMGWWGFGGDLRGHFSFDAGLQAGSALGLARLSALGHGGPLALEAGLGPTLDAQGPGGMGQLGAFVGFYYVEVGYAFRVPIDGQPRPGWMTPHSIALRGHIPVARWGRRETPVRP